MNRRRIAILAASIVIVVVVAAAGVVLLRGSKRSVSCDLIGCDNAVTVDLTSLPADTLAAAKAASICANDRCENVSIGTAQRGFKVTINDRTVRTASIRLTDAGGKELVLLKLGAPEQAIEAQPNGPDCEPTCWLLNLTPKDGALVRSAQQYGQPPTSR